MINQGQIMGRVGKIMSKDLKSGSFATNMSIATNKKYKDKDGNKQEKVTWHTVTMYGKIADIAAKYVSVGDLVYVQGEMDSQKYTAKDGQEKVKHFLLANDIKLIPKGNKIDIKPQATQNQSSFAMDFADEVPF